MLRSMTGFTHSSYPTKKWGSLTIELRCLNQKHLKLSLSLPPWLTHLEGEVYRLLQESSFQRGLVEVRIHGEAQERRSLGRKYHLNHPLLKQVDELKEEAASLLQLTPKEALHLLLQHLPQSLLITKESPTLPTWEELLPPLQDAIQHVQHSRATEGRAIAASLKQSFNSITKEWQAILRLLPAIQEERSRSLKEEMEKLLGELPTESVTPEAVAAEIRKGLEGRDVEEEASRFTTHFHLLQEQVERDSLVSGRSCEFRIQEMGREIHTLSSKIQESTIIESTLIIKVELNRIREHLQNVE